MTLLLIAGMAPAQARKLGTLDEMDLIRRAQPADPHRIAG
jgi:hypothetical protein